MADGMTQLGYEMAEHLQRSSPSGNLVYSPASLAIAFAMVREGAAGAAAQQIDTAVGLPANRSAAFNALLASLQDPGAGNVLSLGDAIFTQRGYDFHRAFLNSLKRWYDAGVYQTTFPDEGKAAVNAYVDKSTHGLIPQLITNEFDSDTRMSLVNTLYLNAEWQQVFDANLTAQRPFTTTHGKVDAHMMSIPGTRTDYASGPGWQAVRLPYRGNRLSMEVLVPTSTVSPVSLLDPQVLADAANGFTAALVNLSLPRWSFGTHASLKTTLKSLGMRAPFEPGGFPGITDDPNFMLDSVIQQAHISVGEKGTVAAAATQIEGIAGAELADLEIVDADHPFAYVVVDNATGAPLFEGTVGDPSQS